MDNGVEVGDGNISLDRIGESQGFFPPAGHEHEHDLGKQHSEYEHTVGCQATLVIYYITLTDQTLKPLNSPI